MRKCTPSVVASRKPISGFRFIRVFSSDHNFLRFQKHMARLTHSLHAELARSKFKVKSRRLAWAQGCHEASQRTALA